MASSYSGRYGKPLGVSNDGYGGAGLNLGIEALAGETDLITVHDDFNGWVKGTDTFGNAAIFEDSGWVLTDVGTPTNDSITLNDPSTVALWDPSCLRIYSGYAADAGGNMQLDIVNGAVGTLVGLHAFPHLYIPETAAGATVLDNTVWVFACRVGFRADISTTGLGDWDSKCFIGWAEAGDTGILTAATGVITQAETGPLYGFHVGEDGSLDGIAQRTVNTAYAEGTNFTELYPAGGVDGTVANGAAADGDTMWFDLALRMHITDMSDNAANGSVRFYHRKVGRVTGAPGLREGHQPGEASRWIAHPTVLLNQTPNNDVALVPTIEMVNGPTAGRDGVLFLDWWTFGCSRYSRMSR